jgi:hypothetical protein
MDDDDRVHIFTWRMAEELAEGHMHHLGFVDARRTPAGTDGGFDVVSGHAVAQVKHHSATVGAPDIQRLRGAAHDGRAALFYSSSGYSTSAVAYADRAGVALFTFDTQAIVTPYNEAAERLQRAASARGLGGGENRITATSEDLDARLIMIGQTNEAIERHIDSLQWGEVDDPTSLSDADWDEYMSSIDRDTALAQITIEWSRATSNVTMRVLERPRLSSDIEELIAIELTRRRKLLELYSLSPEDFPLT